MLLHVSVCDHHHYALCSGVAVYYVQSVVVYMLCVVQVEAELAQTQRRIFTRTFLTIVTLARLKHKLPDDGHRPKHVAAF
jgi:hypothetical protein